MKEKFPKNRNLKNAAFIVAIFLLANFLLTAILYSPVKAQTLGATKNSTIQDLEAKKKAEEERARRARELKAKQEKQAEEAKEQAVFLEGQISELHKKEIETQGSIDKTEDEIGLLTNNISVAEQNQAEMKKRTLEGAKAYFKQRRKKSIDPESGELDIFVGENVSSSASDEAKFEAVAELLRQRMTGFIQTKVALKGQKSVAEDKFQELTNLKTQQSNLKRSKQATQTKFNRLAVFSESEADKYGKEMEEALTNAAYWEKQILQELTRIINARKSGDIPRTGASVGQKVNKGEVVGHQGNTGYSFGSHVHWEVRDDNVAVNPRNYTGSLGWPLDGDFRVTQEFGLTPYSERLYSSGRHTGVDITKYDGANVSASCSGEIILDAVYGGYGRAFAHTCEGTNLVVLYGHLQSE